jgi:hypothetical protein
MVEELLDLVRGLKAADVASPASATLADSFVESLVKVIRHMSINELISMKTQLNSIHNAVEASTIPRTVAVERLAVNKVLTNILKFIDMTTHPEVELGDQSARSHGEQ